MTAAASSSRRWPGRPMPSSRSRTPRTSISTSRSARSRAIHGETLRGLDLKLSRRGGSITNFAINAKIGRGSPLTGDLRGRAGSTRQVIFVESGDAGAFFRFSDIYAKIVGGEMWVAMDPQSADQAPQDGILNIRDFIGARRSRRSTASPVRRPASSSRASSSRGCGSTSPARSAASRSRKGWCAAR